MAGGGRRGSRAPSPLTLRRLLQGLAGLALGWALAAATLFVWPPQHPATKADTVVVLAGGRGPRLSAGLALVRGASRRCSSSRTAGPPQWPEANRLFAGRPAPAKVVCFRPDPSHPRRGGGITRLATEHGWRSVVVVTSGYHVVRTSMLFDRCFDGTVADAGADESLFRRVVAAPIETVKLGYALLVRRGC